MKEEGSCRIASCLRQRQGEVNPMPKGSGADDHKQKRGEGGGRLGVTLHSCAPLVGWGGQVDAFPPLPFRWGCACGCSLFRLLSLGMARVGLISDLCIVHR